MKQLRKIFVALFLFSALLVKSQLHPHYLDGCINFIEYGFDTINNRWIPKGKFSFIQDKKGKLRKEYFKSWNSEKNQWIAQSQTIYKYNKTKDIIEIFYKNRSYKTGKLVNSKKTAFTYKDNLLTEERVYDISEKKAWIASCINNYEYNKKGNMKRCITSKFNKKSFIVCASETRTYDSLYFLKEIEWENTCSGPAAPPLKKTIEYTEDSLKSAEIIISSGINKERIDYNYNEEKQVNQIIYSNWIPDLYNWKAASRDTFEYNNFGLVINKINQKRSDADTSWNNNRSIFYLYNSNLKLIHETEKAWLPKKKCWISIFRRAYKWGE